MKPPVCQLLSHWSLSFSSNAAFTTIIVITLAMRVPCGALGQPDGYSHANEFFNTSRNPPSSGAAADVAVTINTSKVVHITDERFVSVAFTIGDMRFHWQNYDLQSVRLRTLAKGLYPSFLRLGGSRANFATFEDKTPDTQRPRHLKNFTYTRQDWDKINEFSNAVGWNFLFDVNAFLRTAGKWNPHNFKKLLDYSTGRNDRVAGWQIGNEPNSYLHAEGVTISASQVAEDYIKLRAVLDSTVLYAGALLIGPDTTHPKHTKLGTSAVAFLKGFLSVCGDCTNVTTFHSYYLSSRTAKLDDFINPSTLNTLTDEIKDIRSTVAAHRPQKNPRVWLTETGDAVPGGVSGVSDRYAGGFPYLDKLGLGALQGLEVIIKQQLIGRFCGLVNESNYNPRPVYWVAYIHKHLVGQQVLDVTTSKPRMDALRVYAHCTRIKHSKYHPGDVTIIALNLDKARSVRLRLQGVLADKAVNEYLLMPSGAGGIRARYVSLNGVQLKMVNDTHLPELKPRPLTHPGRITLPPLSYGFYVIPEASLQACL